MNLKKEVSTVCPWCGDEFENSHGTLTHIGIVHAEERDDPDHMVNLLLAGSTLDDVSGMVDGPQLKSVWYGTADVATLGELLRFQALNVRDAVEDYQAGEDAPTGDAWPPETDGPHGQPGFASENHRAFGIE